VPDLHQHLDASGGVSGGRSALAGKALKELGFDDVRNLGAFKDRAEAGGPVDKA
jgi:rhodanese-related sulfurtransferase